MKRFFGCCMIAAGLLMSLPVSAQQEWRDSLKRVNQLIRLYPDSIDLRLKKAALNIELEQWDYAIDEYSRVLQRSPKNLAALYYRAYAHNTMRHYDLAKVDYETFLSLVPKHFEAQLGLAMVKKRLGRWLDATDELNKLVQLFPDSALAWAARAGFETEREQYDLALYDWDEALKRHPGNVDFTVSKIDILITLKRFDEAWLLLEQLMKQGVPRAALKEWIDQCK